MWINADTLVTYETVDDVRAAFPEYSFPQSPTNTTFEIVNVFWVYNTIPPEYDPITQNLIADTPVLIDGQWYEAWSVEPATPEEIAERELAAQQSNKEKAESLLQATDWTATVDINNPQYSNPYLGNQTEFLSYRSNVRKIAVNPPITVDVWPVKPQEKWINV